MNTRRLLFIGSSAALFLAAISYAFVELRFLRSQFFVHAKREAELTSKLEAEVRANGELRKRLAARQVVTAVPMASTVRQSPRIFSTSSPAPPRWDANQPGRAYRDQLRAQEEIMRRLHEPGKSGL